MRPHSEEDPTVAYYDENAERFITETAGVDMRPLYEPFLALIPVGGRILDAACGSGRDTRAFLDLGYKVTAFDASRRMAESASRLIGQAVPVLRFQELAFDDEFDGVWACASLLHVPRSELPDIFSRLARCLRRGGIMYASFKRGSGERWERGRRFTDLDAMALRSFVSDQGGFEIVRMWETEDLRPGRVGEPWLNVLLTT
jgi:SAM-dependent methyltransferase